MKRHITRFVWNLNGFLLFAILSVALVTLIVTGIKQLFPRHIEPTDRGVEIIANTPNDEENKKAEVYVGDSTVIKDTLIFELRSQAIERSEFGNDKQIYYYSKRSGNNTPSTIINLVFINLKNGSVKELFKEKKYIENVQYTNQTESEYKPLLEKNVYLLVEKDTNGDQKLTDNDEQSIFISEYNGDNVSRIADKVITCKLIKDNILLYCTTDQKRNIFKTYNIKTRETKELYNTDYKYIESGSTTLLD